MRPSLAPLLLLLALAGCGRPPAERGAPVHGARGAEVYARHCAACHQSDGRGLAGRQPSLAGSATTVGDPAELLAWVMFGERPAGLASTRSVVVMPNFAWLSDEDLAAVLSHVRSDFGNAAPAVDPAAVAAVRAARGR